MKKLLTATICSVLLIAGPVFAGAGHEHNQAGGHSHGPITKEKAISKAEKLLNRLVKRGKVDKSWGNKKAANAEKKTYSGKNEWVVSFNNPDLTDKSKQTLYMFFKLDGHYLATNYSGK